MKSFLYPATLVFLSFFMLAHPGAVYSQACMVSNLRIKVNSITTTSTSCQVNATISWIQQSNGGNKFTNFHIWPSTTYPNPVLSYSKPPTSSDLAQSLGTFVIDNPGGSTPTFDGSYPPAAGVPLITKTASTVVTKVSNTPSAGSDSFNVSNVLVTLSNTVSCSNHFILKADIWSSQSNSDNAVQCFNTNGTFATTDVNITGQITCSNPRQFQTTISTSSSTTVNFNYQVYADQAHTGSFAQSDPQIYSGSGSTTSGTSFNSGQINNTSYPNDNLIVVAQVSGNPVSTFGVITNNCPTPLPVTLVYFNARWTEGSGVLLSWETATEQNNKGFEVQRKTGTGDFQTIAFIPSKALNGSSDGILSYEYIDAGTFNGDVEYRLAQVDLDGQMKYSPLAKVKEVNNKESGLFSAYPNPSPDGVVTLSFRNTDNRDILVIDICGKIIKHVSEVSANHYTLSGLRAGVYILKVINDTNGQANTSKIIVER